MKTNDAAATKPVAQSPEGVLGTAESREPANTARRPSRLSIKTRVRAGGGEDEGYESQQDNEPALRAEAPSEPRELANTVRRQNGFSIKTRVKAGGGPGTGYESEQDNEPALRAPASRR